jgi:hypothetical protein
MEVFHNLKHTVDLLIYIYIYREREREDPLTMDYFDNFDNGPPNKS